jgi:hypothetical protein
MSAVPDRVLTVARPSPGSSDCMWIPLLGGLWVLANVGLAVLGIHINWPGTCSFVAGLINGTLLSIAAVAMASERFQAGTTGLLGGLSLSGLRDDGSMIWKAMQSVHGLVDDALRAMGIELNEKLHHAIEQETLYMVWTVVFVVMASLAAEWVRAARAQKG